MFVWRVFWGEFWIDPKWKSQPGNWIPSANYALSYAEGTHYPFCWVDEYITQRPTSTFMEGSVARRGQFHRHLFHHLAPSLPAPCQSHKVGLKAFEVSDGWSFSVANPKQACLAVNCFVIIFFLVVFCFPLYNLAWFKSSSIEEKNKGKIYSLPGVPVGFFTKRKEQAEPKAGITVWIKWLDKWIGAVYKCPCPMGLLLARNAEHPPTWWNPLEMTVQDGGWLCLELPPSSKRNGAILK